MNSRPYAAASLFAAILAVGCAHTSRSHKHVEVASAPPAVLAGFHREFPGLNLSHTDLVREADGTTQYELKFRDANNKYHHKMYSPDGTLLSDKGDVMLPDATHPAPDANP